MPETAEGMSEQYTRSELEEMARKLGISPARKNFPSKTSLAEAIVKSKETSKGKPITPPETKPSYKPVARVEMRAGKTGVMAKKAAIDAQVNENKNDVEKIDEEIRDFRASADMKVKSIFGNVRIMQDNIGVEVGEIRNAVAKIDASVKDLQKDIAKEKSSMDESTRKMHGDVDKFRGAMDTKVKSIFGNVRIMQDSIEAQAGENKDAAAGMDAAVKDLQKDIAKEKSSMDESTKKKQADVKNFQTAMDMATREIQSGVSQLEKDILGLRGDIASYRQEFYFG